MDARRIPFSPADEERIASAGLWGMIVAITSMVSTALSTVTAVVQVLRVGSINPELDHYRPFMMLGVLVPGLVSLTLVLILGIWLLQASQAFRKVALTDTADQHYLLLGFRKLRNYFMMMGILIIIAISGSVLLVCGSFVCGSMLRGV